MTIQIIQQAVHEQDQYRPPIGECECSNRVNLSGLRNICFCGKIYGPCGELIGHQDLEKIEFQI